MIVLDGELGAYEGIGHEDVTKDLIPTTTIATLGTWGETGMTEDETWTHTVKATKKSLVLSLLKKDLIEVLSHVKGIEQRNKQSFLLKSQFLNELSYNRVAEFNELLQEQRFYTNDIIYDQAAEASAFYIVKRGTVKVEAAVEIEHQNVYPHGKGRQWKLVNTKKKCLYRVRDLKPGEIFGHDELLEHFDNVLQTGQGSLNIPRRQYRMVAAEKSDVMYINVAKFYYFFTDSELKKMKSHVVHIDK